MGVEVRARIRPTFKLYAAVAVYSIRALLLALNSLILMFIPYILSSTLNLSNLSWPWKIYWTILAKNYGSNLTLDALEKIDTLRIGYKKFWFVFLKPFSFIDITIKSDVDFLQ